MNDQKFEQWLQEALVADVEVPADFTSRVMDRVAATPQEYPRKNAVDKRKLKRMMTALAACAAIVILIPMGLLMMPKGGAAPAADGAAQESLVMDDAAADAEYYAENFTEGADSAEEEKHEAANGAAEPAESLTDGGEALQYTNSDEKARAETLYLFGDEAVQVRVALAEMGREADGAENGAKVYELTAEEAANLHELLPEIIKQEDALHLMLEIDE